MSLGSEVSFSYFTYLVWFLFFSFFLFGHYEVCTSAANENEPDVLLWTRGHKLIVGMFCKRWDKQHQNTALVQKVTQNLWHTSPQMSPGSTWRQEGQHTTLTRTCSQSQVGWRTQTDEHVVMKTLFWSFVCALFIISPICLNFV